MKVDHAEDTGADDFTNGADVQFIPTTMSFNQVYLH